MTFQTGLKIIITLLLALLAGNTWLGLSVQEKIAAKSVELEHLLNQSAQKSQQVNNQLAMIREIDQKTALLDGKITQILENTKGLDNELKKLDPVVAAIARHVRTIGGNTSVTLEDLRKIKQTLASGMTHLKSMQESNRRVVSALESMRGIQQKINRELAEMNRKTGWIPEKGGAR